MIRRTPAAQSYTAKGRKADVSALRYAIEGEKREIEREREGERERDKRVITGISTHQGTDSAVPEKICANASLT